MRIELDALKPENILKLLAGQESNLVSVDVNQSLSVNSSVPVFAAPVFSLLGIINADVAVNVNANFGIGLDIHVGIDTTGFYVGATNPNEFAVRVDGTIGGTVVGTGRLTVVPLAEARTSLGLAASGGVRLKSTDGDDKLRMNELRSPSSFDVGMAVDLGLKVEAELGLISVGLSREFLVLDKVFPLYRATGSGADITGDLARAADKIEREGKAIALLTGNPIAILAAFGPDAWNALQDAGGQVNQFVDNTAATIASGFNNAASQLGNAISNAGAQAGALANKGREALSKIGNQALAGIGLGDAGSIFGAGGFNAIEVPQRRSFTAYREGNAIVVQGLANHGIQPLVQGLQISVARADDGRIIIDGPNFTLNEKVGYRESSCWNGCNKDWEFRDYEHFNRQIFDPVGISRIVVLGTAHADEILIDSSISYNASLYGYDGDDVLVGGSGHDFVTGGIGNDRLFGGLGNDLIEGNQGDDTMVGGDGLDTLRGGDGRDTIDESSDYSGMGNILLGDAGDDTIRGSSSGDSIHGGSGNDTIDGLDGNDLVYGGLIGIAFAVERAMTRSMARVAMTSSRAAAD